MTPYKKANLTFLLFTAPALIFLLLFWVVPIGASIGISFTDWDFMTSDFQITGLANYRALLDSDAFADALVHTLLFTLETVLPSIILGFLLALLITSRKTHGLYPVILFSPWVTPTVAISILWTWIFEPDAGLANGLLEWMGISGIPWLHSSSTALAAVAIVTVWKNLGYVMLLFIGGLTGIPTELYEAASVDGAGRWQRFIHVTLPQVSPYVGTVCLIMTVEALRAYDQIQILTQGGPSGSTRTLMYLYYQLGFEQFETGQAAAVVVVIMAAGLTLALLQSLLKAYISPKNKEQRI